MSSLPSNIRALFSIRALLSHLEVLPDDTCATIKIYGQDEKWIFEATDLKNILMGVLIEIPALRDALDEARDEAETLQEQIIRPTLVLKPPRWEYFHFYFSAIDAHYTTEINKIGGLGWELIVCDLKEGHAIFKRPK